MPPSARTEKLRAFLLGSAVALIVTGMLIPSEAAIAFGSHVIVVMGWLVLFAVWLTQCTLQERPVWHVGPVGASIGLFLVLHTASALVMMGPGHGRPTLNALWLWISFGLLFFTLRQLARRPSEQRAMVSVLIALGVGLSSFGVYQTVWVYPEIRAAYEENPDQALRQAGLHEASPTQRRHFRDRLHSTEPVGPFALTNSLAGVLSPCLVLLLGLFPALRRTREDGRWERGAKFFFQATLAGMLASSLILTKSRAGYVAVLAGCGGLLLCRPTLITWLRKRWRGALVAAAALVLLGSGVAFFGGVDREVLTEAPKSLRYRFQYWRSAAALIADHPWWGCGPGNFKDYYTQYKLPAASETIAEPHNFLVEVAATAGLPALLAFLAIGGVSARRVRAGYRRQTATAAQEEQNEKQGGVGAVYVGTAAGFLFAYPAGWVGGQSPALGMLWVALPATLASLWILSAWVRRGHLALGVLLVAAGALLINLLAAGGISFPGVASVLWVLLAVALNRVESGEPAAEVSRSSGRLGPQVARGRIAAAAIGAFLGVLLSYMTMYRPVLADQHFLAFYSHPRAQGWPDAAESVARESRHAAEADPWWARPCDERAEALHYLWIAAPSAERLAAFKQAADAAQQRNSHSSELANRQGQRLMAMYAAAGQESLLQHAIKAFRRAVQLYPNNSLLHARLAWAYFRHGQLKQAHREAGRALELDRQMPHQELKLKHQVPRPWRRARKRPLNSPLSGGADAEQFMRDLRKHTGGAP